MKEEIKIREVENGYKLWFGEKEYVFQSFCELVNFLNKLFTTRNENIMSDYYQQTAVHFTQ